MFIVIEGPDGAGTTTQSKRLARALDAHWTREPAGNPIGETVDDLITDDDASPETIALAFAADRLLHLDDEVEPALDAGDTVVCDRYYHSSFTYQVEHGVDIDWVETINKHAREPDITIILDVPAETGMDRIDGRDESDIFENGSFQARVRQRYLTLAEETDGVFVVDATGDEDEVFNAIMDTIADAIYHAE